jgi:hypothetical protein
MVKRQTLPGHLELMRERGMYTGNERHGGEMQFRNEAEGLSGDGNLGQTVTPTFLTSVESPWLKLGFIAGAIFVAYYFFGETKRLSPDSW